MNMRGILIVIVFGTGLALAGEVGTRLEVEEGAPSGLGWLALSQKFGGVTLSGRAEVNLLPLGFRRASLGASARWADFSLQAETILLGRGRVNLLATASWKGQLETVLGDLSLQVGAKGTLADLLGARFATVVAWVFGRMDEGPLWVEGRMDASWPGTVSPGELRLGVQGPRWATVALSANALSLELGARQGRFSALTYLSPFPLPMHTVSVSAGEEVLRLHWRLTVRARGDWSGNVTITAREGPWRLSLLASFSGKGWEKTTVEVTFGLGE